jgi:hypothetical protein
MQTEIDEAEPEIAKHFICMYNPVLCNASLP